jgi:hypothetical protein
MKGLYEAPFMLFSKPRMLETQHEVVKMVLQEMPQNDPY